MGIDVVHIFSPDESAIAGATAAGTFVAVLLRRPGYIQVLTWFAVGQVTSFYFVLPIAIYLMLAMVYYRPLGFLIGAIGMLVWGAVFSFWNKVGDDPIGTIGGLWRLFRGQGGSEK